MIITPRAAKAKPDVMASITQVMISSLFAMIEKEPNPFTAKVKKRITTVLIITCVILALTSGLAFAALGVIITWALNAIIDYGITLQTQSDETL